MSRFSGTGRFSTIAFIVIFFATSESLVLSQSSDGLDIEIPTESSSGFDPSNSLFDGPPSAGNGSSRSGIEASSPSQGTEMEFGPLSRSTWLGSGAETAPPPTDSILSTPTLVMGNDLAKASTPYDRIVPKSEPSSSLGFQIPKIAIGLILGLFCIVGGVVFYFLREQD